MIVIIMLASVIRVQAESLPKIWSSGAHFTWIGDETSNPDNIIVTINGSPVLPEALTINNYNGSVHLRVQLMHGTSNLVSIQERDIPLFNADIFYAPTYESALVPEEYELKSFHIEESEAACVDCHRLKPQESDMIPGNPLEKICFPCHNDKFSDLKFQHKAAGINWECLRCHQAEALETDYSFYGPIKFTIKEGKRVAPLCYQCHEEQKKNYADNKYLHGPIAMGRCNMCHNPHGSNFKYFLQKEKSALCIECHEMQTLLKKPNTHKPVVKEGCIFCHNPHGSKYPLLLASEVKELCLKCHPKTEEQKSNHPVTGHPVSAAKDPHNPERPFSCVSCHNPHASDFDKMLPVEEVMMLCMNCHSSNWNY